MGYNRIGSFLLVKSVWMDDDAKKACLYCERENEDIDPSTLVTLIIFLRLLLRLAHTDLNDTNTTR